MPAANRSGPSHRNEVAAAAANRIASLDLTPAERSILHWFIAIPDNKAIAAFTKRRPQTIRNHLASVINKLEVRTREGLLIFLYTGEKLWLSG